MWRIHDGREWSNDDGAGVPHTESRCDDLTLAALDSLSFLTLSKKRSSLFMRNFSMDSSCFELCELRACSFCTKSVATPPSASVNYRGVMISRAQIQQTKILTSTIALFSGEFAFSSTIDAMDSTDDTRECAPNGRDGAASKNGSAALLFSFAIVRFALSKKLPYSCRVSMLGRPPFSPSEMSVLNEPLRLSGATSRGGCMVSWLHCPGDPGGPGVRGLSYTLAESQLGCCGCAWNSGFQSSCSPIGLVPPPSQSDLRKALAPAMPRLVLILRRWKSSIRCLHSTTGKRCTAERARRMARSSSDDFRAILMVFVNWDIMCSVDVDSTGNHCGRY